MSTTREVPLDNAVVSERLAHDLPSWTLEGGFIRRTYKTNSWKGTLMVINTVGHLAEAAWHHPDLTASYAWVEVRLKTHSAKGITEQGHRARKQDRGGAPLASGVRRRSAGGNTRHGSSASPISNMIDAAAGSVRCNSGMRLSDWGH
jgi:pterin-4a-carbinolamine dehydratase